MPGQSQPRRVVVGGQTWEVSRAESQYHFHWLSGRADGYGFTTCPNHPEAELSERDIERTIAEFMSNVNAETGYLD
jgi:hypothetical protein